jgi:hypothetical protein
MPRKNTKSVAARGGWKEEVEERDGTTTTRKDFRNEEDSWGA